VVTSLDSFEVIKAISEALLRTSRGNGQNGMAGIAAPMLTLMGRPEIPEQLSHHRRVKIAQYECSQVDDFPERKRYESSVRRAHSFQSQREVIVEMEGGPDLPLPHAGTLLSENQVRRF
jgi:hypothetical protein